MTLTHTKAVIFVPTYTGLIQSITYSIIVVIGYLNYSFDYVLGLRLSMLRVVFGENGGSWLVVPNKIPIFC